MAEGDGVAYNEFKYQLLNGVHNLANAGDVIKTMLVTAHTPDIDTDTAYADASGDEESGTGYTATGETLAGQVTTKETATDRGKFDGTDETWTGLDVGTPNYAIMYNSTDDSLMAHWEIATASNGGDYTLNWHADGIIYLS